MISMLGLFQILSEIEYLINPCKYPICARARLQLAVPVDDRCLSDPNGPAAETA